VLIDFSFYNLKKREEKKEPNEIIFLFMEKSWTQSQFRIN